MHRRTIKPNLDVLVKEFKEGLKNNFDPGYEKHDLTFLLKTFKQLSINNQKLVSKHAFQKEMNYSELMEFIRQKFYVLLHVDQMGKYCGLGNERPVC